MKNFKRLSLIVLKMLILIIFLVVGLVATTQESINISKIQRELKAATQSTVSSFKEIAAGGKNNEGRSMAIDTEGNLYSWGCRIHLTLGQTEPTSRNITDAPARWYNLKFSKIDNGSTHSLAIDTNQNLWVTGKNDYAQLGNGTKTDNETTLIKIKADTKFKEVAAGNNFSAAIDIDGNLWTWGYNNNGQLGNGGISESLIPVKIKEGTKFEEISAGQRHSLAIDSSGDLWAWGDNSDGQLGDGTTDMSVEPIKIKEGTKFKEISAGQRHSLAIDSEGNLWGWGDLRLNTAQESLIPIQIMSGTKFEKISGGLYHSFAIDTNKTLWAWGLNTYGQLGNGTTTDSETPIKINESIKFKQVSTSDYHTIALDQYGRMYAWGSNKLRQLGLGTGYYADYYDESRQVTASVTYYTVNFMDGENIAKTETVMSGNRATAPSLSKAGYTLSWDTDFSSVKSDLTVNAVWTANEVTVTFKNGSETAKTETVEYGKGAIAPELTKAGYTLSWDKAFNNVTSNLTVNAVWTANTNTAYKIEHYKQNTSLNGYDLLDTENKTGTTDTTVTASKKTYTGFTENTSYSGRVASGTVVGNGSLVLKLYYDRNSYTVTLNANGGTINAGNVTSYTYGIAKTLPTNVSKTGYTFGGWYVNSDLSGNAVTSIGATETGNKTYYAKWTINKYTVTFKNGSETAKTETVEYGKAATAPSLTKAGYTLSWDKAFSNVTSNLTVNAVWTANTNTAYKVEYYKQNINLNGYELAETENKTAKTNEQVTATSKVYQGFTENTEHSERVVSGNIAGDGSLVLKLYYDRNIYNITYELNGGTASSELTNSYIYGKELVLSNRVTKQGYEFSGWYENDEFTGDVITKIGTDEIGDKEYFAKWTQNEFTVTFKDGEKTQKTQVVKKGESATAPELIKEGHWLSWDKEFENVTSDITVNAIWTINTYTVIFKDGDTISKEQTVNYGSEATAPELTKEGYTLSWDKEFGNITSDIIVNAVWTINTFKVIFKNGDIISKEETVNYGTEATAPELTKAGYTLSWDKEFTNVTSDITVNAVWTANTNTVYKVEHYLRNLDREVEGYDLFETEELTGTTDTEATAVPKTYTGFTYDTENSNEIVSGNIVGDGSLVLKLYYSRNSYSITYELNEGIASSELTNSYIYGKGLVLSNRVTKQGHVFAGWYANSELTGESITAIGKEETGDKTYYAKWIEEEFYITSEKYSVNMEEKQITKVSPKTNIVEFIGNLDTTGNIKIFDLAGEEVSGDTLVGTGYKLQIDFKGTKYEYEIAVRGDLDGNGKISVTDLSILNQVMVKKLTLTGVRAKASDLDFSNKTTITDLSMMNQAIVGKITL